MENKWVSKVFRLDMSISIKLSPQQKGGRCEYSILKETSFVYKSLHITFLPRLQSVHVVFMNMYKTILFPSSPFLPDVSTFSLIFYPAVFSRRCFQCFQHEHTAIAGVPSVVHHSPRGNLKMSSLVWPYLILYTFCSQVSDISYVVSPRRMGNLNTNDDIWLPFLEHPFFMLWTTPPPPRPWWLWVRKFNFLVFLPGHPSFIARWYPGDIAKGQ